ncbi:MAG: hypothetical protein ACKVQW_03540 [Pyrinomonadaceae bacterium]
MAKDVITVDGKDVVVREDTAKAYRFVHWGVITAAICLAITAFLFVTFFWMATSDGKLESPAQVNNSNNR